MVAPKFDGMRFGASLPIALAVFLRLCVIPNCFEPDSRVFAQNAAAPPLEFVGAWGVKGDGPGQLQEPVSISTDGLGNAYIADRSSHFIHKFDAQGKPLLSFQEDPLKHPEWITLDRGGAIYVADPGRSSVFVFLPNGDHFRELRLRTRPDAGKQMSVAVSEDGIIHVLDSNAGEVFTFTQRFRLRQTWNPPRNPSGPKDQLGPIQIGPDESIYIANAPSGRILKFTAQEHLVSEIGASPDPADRRLSNQFAVSGNYLFVMDTNGLMLHVLTPEGRAKMDVDLAPELGQGSRRPPALAISPRKELLVLDTPEARVLRYRIHF
jgi:hypothetical protein